MKDEWPEILSRAEHYRIILSQPFRSRPDDEGKPLWTKLREPLLKATTEEEVRRVFREHAGSYATDFVLTLAQPILDTIRENKFPKQNEQAQIKFLADSIAALGRVSPRRSRNICQEERRKQRKTSWNSDQQVFSALRRNLADCAIDGVFSEPGFSIDGAV